jgi:hypothetical protein
MTPTFLQTFKYMYNVTENYESILTMLNDTFMCVISFGKISTALNGTRF